MKKIELDNSEEVLAMMNDAGYSKKAISFYLNQTNVGKIAHPDAVSSCLGPCGDLIRLYLKIDSEDVILDAKFFYLGCPGVAACVSALTTLIIGKSLNQANRITEKDLLMELEELPKSKQDCLKLSVRALKQTIQEYVEIKSSVKKYW